jgi:cyclic nucleotide gated channel
LFFLNDQLNTTKERDWNNPRQLLLDILTKENMCDSLKPMFYNEQCYILKEGDPIDAIFLITDGIVWSSNNSNNNGKGAIAASRQVERLEKGQLFGEELLDWSWNKDFSPEISKFVLPISSKTLKTHTKVEAFALMADDYKKIASRRYNLGKKQVE